jgi:hypothetical protein
VIGPGDGIDWTILALDEITLAVVVVTFGSAVTAETTTAAMGKWAIIGIAAGVAEELDYTIGNTVAESVWGRMFKCLTFTVRA